MIIPTAIVFVAICLIVLSTIACSLTFRMHYLRQKCLNRMSEEEIEQMKKTSDDFWSFLK